MKNETNEQGFLLAEEVKSEKQLKKEAKKLEEYHDMLDSNSNLDEDGYDEDGYYDLSIGGDLNLINAKITSLDGVPKWIGGALSKEQILSMHYDRICMLHKYYNLDKYKIDTSLFSDEEVRKYNAEIETAKFIDIICKKGKKYLTDLQRSSASK